jgi:hypothetical protein
MPLISGLTGSPKDTLEDGVIIILKRRSEGL